MNGPGFEFSHETKLEDVSGCPFHAVPANQTILHAKDRLVFPKHKRVITEYSKDVSGNTELHLFYGEKEILFDEPELFAFGEELARQPHFVAEAATTWGDGYDWPYVRELLQNLIDESILQRVDDVSELTIVNHSCPSPLSESLCTVPRTWADCEDIFLELTGHKLELGYLELVVPIYRVAHIAMDAEGRQIGEANVFPTQLRLDIPTEWRICQHSGSRYQDEHPMNVTALKSMRKHWHQTMAVLLKIRETYLQRFPKARQGWTVGDLQRLSTLVLSLPTYLLMRSEGRVESGHLHPVLSTMFRVTDGLRMITHNMLFTPINEPSLSPNAPMDCAEIYAFAERNNVFLSETGVCAGPKAMIDEFLSVLIDGKQAGNLEGGILDTEIESALAAIDSAFDYELLSLQAYFIVFMIWPKMCRTYENLFAIVDARSEENSETFIEFRECLKKRVGYLKTDTFLGTENQRIDREQLLSELYCHSSVGLGSYPLGKTLPEILLLKKEAKQHVIAKKQLTKLLKKIFFGSSNRDRNSVHQMVDVLMDYFQQEQAILVTAIAIQKQINQLLGRSSPRKAFTASDFGLYYALQKPDQRLPNLVDDLKALLGLNIVVTEEAINIFEDKTKTINNMSMGRIRPV